MFDPKATQANTNTTPVTQPIANSIAHYDVGATTNTAADTGITADTGDHTEGQLI